MSNVTTNLIWALRDDVSASARKMDATLKGVGLSAKGTTGVLGKLGNVTGGLVTPTNIAAAGVLALGAVLVKGVDAAIDEEESIARLTSSLKANVPAWNGNTSAIEKVLAARMKLGFSDDEQRTSLARLVGATRDVSKALELERVAMDLARFKKIDLYEASEALIKIEGGQYRALKGLIGSTKDITTSEQALAAVHRVAGGAATDLAETNRGKLTVSNVMLGESLEKLGGVVMPIVSEALTTAAELATGLAGALDILSGKLPETEVALAGTAESALDFVAGLGILSPMAAELAQKAKRDLTPALNAAAGGLSGLGDRAHDLAGDIVPLVSLTARKLTPSLYDLADAAGDATSSIDVMGAKFDAVWNHLSAVAQGVADDIFGPQIRASDLAANNREQAAQRVIIASGKSTKAEIADAKDRLLALQKEGLGIQIEMAGRGELTKTAYDKLIAKLQEQAKSGNLEIRNSARIALAELVKLSAGISTISRQTGGTVFPAGIRGIGMAAKGGPVRGLTVVGEEGPELADFGSGGHVWSNPQSRAMLGGGGVTLVYAPQFSSASPAEAQRFARAIMPEFIREARRQTVL